MTCFSLSTRTWPLTSNGVWTSFEAKVLRHWHSIRQVVIGQRWHQITAHAFAVISDETAAHSASFVNGALTSEVLVGTGSLFLLHLVLTSVMVPVQHCHVTWSRPIWRITHSFALSIVPFLGHRLVTMAFLYQRRHVSQFGTCLLIFCTGQTMRQSLSGALWIWLQLRVAVYDL